MTTPPPPPPPPGMSSMPGEGNQPSSDDKTMAYIAHFGIILFGFIPPLIIYLVKKDNPWVKAEAAKAFNFVIVLNGAALLISIINNILGFIDNTGIFALVFFCATCLIPLALWITAVVFGIMNGVRTSNGEPTSYPFEVPILK